MQVQIIDQEGLEHVLMMKPYSFSRSQIVDAKSRIRALFIESASMLFQGVLARKMPETIEVRMVQNTNDEMENGGMRLASYDSSRSSNKSFAFVVYEVSMAHFIEEANTEKVRGVILHEMMHAADWVMIQHSQSLLNAISARIKNKINEQLVNSFVFSNIIVKPDEALFDALYMLQHYRAEGVAILGECLLTNQRNIHFMNELAVFRTVFISSMYFAQSKVNGASAEDAYDGFLEWAKYQDYIDPIVMAYLFGLRLYFAEISGKGLSIDEAYNKWMQEQAYVAAPCIIVMVLWLLKFVDTQLMERLMDGLHTGNYDLTQEETTTVLNASLSLSLQEYTQGLVSSSGHRTIVPIEPFLHFCALFQDNIDEDGMKAFAEMNSNPDLTLEDFIHTIRDLIGMPMDDNELKESYDSLCERPCDNALTAKTKDEIDSLYALYQNDNDPRRKQVALWALTYFFDDQDIIYDNTIGFGWIDDMIVLESAMRILDNNHGDNKDNSSEIYI